MPPATRPLPRWVPPTAPTTSPVTVPSPAFKAPAPRIAPPPAPPGPARAATPVPAPRPAPEPRPAALWPEAGEGLNLVRGPGGQRRICLTFDGGSTAEAASDVLDALRARQLRTTLFLTGAFIQRFPDLVRRIVREGHEVGNHTMTHPHFAPGYRRDPQWTRERFQAELLAADRAFLALTGRPMAPYWRAPFGEHTVELRRWAEELGYRHVGWSEGADTLDWATPKERRLYRTGNAILDRLHARMDQADGDGLVVLMHLGSERPEADRPARILGAFLDASQRDGWHFVTVGAYLHDARRPEWDPRLRLPLLAPPDDRAGLPVR
jgi:peptidoglycan-N-acetylglucosamine deacetylase